jgi:hypothetical protein
VTKRLIIACAFLAAVPFAASASKLISCVTCDPPPTVLMSLDGTGLLDVEITSSADAFSYENDTGEVISSLEFDGFIAKGLTPDTTIVNGSVTEGVADNTIFQNFTCDQTVTEFFQNCTITYDSITGELSYLFNGIETPPASTSPSVLNFGDWQGNDWGIPSCTEFAADPAQCYDPSGLDYHRGFFTLAFNNFDTNPDYIGGSDGPPPNFMGSYTVATPEPSYVVLLVSGLFLVWFIRRRKVAQ